MSQRRRINIWLDFWNKTYNDRKTAMWSLLSRNPTASRNSSRNWYVTYNLVNDDGRKVKVCKTLFLATLGYPKTSSIIQTLLNTSPTKIAPNPDKRGETAPHNALTHVVKRMFKNTSNHTIRTYPTIDASIPPTDCICLVKSQKLPCTPTTTVKSYRHSFL